MCNLTLEETGAALPILAKAIRFLTRIRSGGAGAPALEPGPRYISHLQAGDKAKSAKLLPKDGERTLCNKVKLSRKMKANGML